MLYCRATFPVYFEAKQDPSILKQHVCASHLHHKQGKRVQQEQSVYRELIKDPSNDA